MTDKKLKGRNYRTEGQKKTHTHTKIKTEQREKYNRTQVNKKSRRHARKIVEQRQRKREGERQNVRG